MSSKLLKGGSPKFSLEVERSRRLIGLAMAKQERVVVYSIAFLAPKVGQEQLQACASSASHYFEVNGSNSAAAAGLSQAFNTIAGNINQLQLTE